MDGLDRLILCSPLIAHCLAVKEFPLTIPFMTVSGKITRGI